MGLDNKQAFFICSNENVVLEVDWNAAGLMGFYLCICGIMLWFGKGWSTVASCVAYGVTFARKDSCQSVSNFSTLEMI